jgi:hypothetical protein
MVLFDKEKGGWLLHGVPNPPENVKNFKSIHLRFVFTMKFV